MAIDWGNTEDHLRIGWDMDFVNLSETSVTVKFRLYAEPVPGGWDWNDDMFAKITGSAGSSTVNFHKNSSQQLIATRTLTASRRSGGGPTWTVSASIGGAFNGASPSASRSYTVPAKNAGPPGPPLAASIQTRAGSVTSSSAIVEWGNSADNNGAVVDGYRVILATTSGFSNIIREETHTGHSQQFTGLTRASTYWYRVACRNSEGWGGYSSVDRSFTTDPRVPNVVPRNSPSLITPTSVRLTWDLPSDDGGRPIDEYLVSYRRVGNITWAEAGSLDREHDITGLSPGTEYEWRVQAKNSVGWSDLQSPVEALNWTTTVSQPSAPDRPTVSGVTATQATVSWVTPVNNGTPIIGFDVQRSTNSTFSGSTTHVIGLVNSYTIGSLGVDTGYFVRVRARTATGDGAWSPSRSFNTSAIAVPYPVIRYWNGSSWVRLDPMSIWNGTDWTEVSDVRYWNGSAFVSILDLPY